MTYAELEARLADRKMDSTLSALREAVRAETDALVDIAKPRRKTAKVAAVAREQAEAFYADEIESWVLELKRGATLTPNDVLHYRRRATCWAVALLLREVSR